MLQVSYAKRTGTNLTRLPHARIVSKPLHQALEAQDWRTREEGLVIAALRPLNRLLRDIGLPTVDHRVGFFWVRPHAASARTWWPGSRPQSRPGVRALPRGVGSVEQWSHIVDVLVEPARRLLSYTDGNSLASCCGAGR